MLLFSHYVVSNSLQPHGLHAACQTFLSFTIFQSLLKFMSTELVMLSHPLPPPFPFAFNLSLSPLLDYKLFQNRALIQPTSASQIPRIGLDTQ